MEASGNGRRLVYVSSYLPRLCGIATFTGDLALSIHNLSHTPFRVVAVNDREEGYDYSQEVAFEVQQHRIETYRRAAEYINNSSAEAVLLQHEFGLFGGVAGEYAEALLKNLDKPVLTTLHTVLREPTSELREAMLGVLRYSDKVAVLSQISSDILQQAYGVSPETISLIRHGVPDVSFVDSSFYKDRYGLEGRLVILTFGLLNPNKGIEYMIEALPEIVQEYPEVVYVVLGATHPAIWQAEGELYRISLERRVRDLGLENHVVFHNQFVETEDLYQYILASDYYVTPYLTREQVSSGTLSYALGMGKAIISTPYWYAQELLADDRGILVPFRDSSALSRAILGLLRDPLLFNRMRKRAYEYGRSMTWPQVASGYLEALETVLAQRSSLSQPRFTRDKATDHLARATLPEVNLEHLQQLYDDTGFFASAPCGIPDRKSGYSTRAAGQAVAALCKLYRLEKRSELKNPLLMGLSFLAHSQDEAGFFRAAMTYERKWVQERDPLTLGAAVWALGNIVRAAPTTGSVGLAMQILERAEGLLEKDLHEPQGMAMAICGLYAVLKRFEGAIHSRQLIYHLGRELVQRFQENRGSQWHWWADQVQEGAARIPESLFRAFEVSGESDFKQTGLEALEFLLELQWNGSYFELIGTNGWLTRDGYRAYFGQLPVDAGAWVEALRKAYDITREPRYYELAQYAMEWFFGRNRLGVPLYDAVTGGVCDGLDPQGASENRGVQANSAYLLALVTLLRLSLQTEGYPKELHQSAGGPG